MAHNVAALVMLGAERESEALEERVQAELAPVPDWAVADQVELAREDSKMAWEKQGEELEKEQVFRLLSHPEC